MHFKRKRPKSGRSGCLMCKPWKRQGSCRKHRDKFSDRRRATIACEMISRIDGDSSSKSGPQFR